MRKTLLFLTAALVIGGMIFYMYMENNKPSPRSASSGMPPVVDDSMSTLLQALEMELEKNRPDIIPFLKPGITAAELEQAESNLGQPIHPEMRDLYRWHNGLANDKELFPGFGYWSLEEAVQTNQEFTEAYQEKGLGWIMAHEKNWLILFPDGAGDGYYYDPSRQYETGGVFYNFRENSYYRYFPSIKNLLKAIVECFQAGVYPQNEEPDFDMEERIMDKYGIAIEQS